MKQEIEINLKFEVDSELSKKKTKESLFRAIADNIPTVLDDGEVFIETVGLL